MDSCHAHETSLLCVLPAAYTANYQAASAMVGLTPTLFASLSPSVTETSLLSALRPLLSFMISLGRTAAYPLRAFFKFTDLYLMLRHIDHMLKLPPLGRMSAVLCSIPEHTLALAANQVNFFGLGHINYACYIKPQLSRVYNQLQILSIY